MQVAQLRYIQSIHESPERRNPDELVRRFLPLIERLRLRWMSPEDLQRLRAEPFYYYLVARTQHYDRVFSEAPSKGLQQIVNIGCGTDTRAHRFGAVLRSNDMTVLEIDQAQSISVKERLAGRWRAADRIHYAPIDLNDRVWPSLKQWLHEHRQVRTLVVMEGVSPYINADAFTHFLDFLASSLAPSSIVAYDFKCRDVDSGLPKADETGPRFRQSSVRSELAAFHEARGFQLDWFESSADLSRRYLKSAAPARLFTEDGLVELRVVGGGERAGDSR